MNDTLTKVHVRWFIRMDMPAVIAFASWTEEEFLQCLRKRNCIGMVAEIKDRPVGYMIYDINDQTKINILTFGVDPIYQRQGIGRQMMDKLVSKLRPYWRTHLTVTVPTEELDFLVFLTRYGFKAEPYNDGTKDCSLTFFPKEYHKDY